MSRTARIFPKELHLAEDLETLNNRLKDDTAVQKLETEMNKNTKPLQKKATATRMFNSLKSLGSAFDTAVKEKDEEQAYLFAMRYIDLYFALRKSEQFLADPNWHKNVRLLKEVVTESERLSSSLQERYLEKQAVKAAAKAPSVVIHHVSPDEAISKKENVKPKVRSDFKSSIDAKELHQLLKDHKNSVLLVDIRESENFASSQIKFNAVINIPEEKLNNRSINAGYLGEVIDPRMQDLWKRRHTFDHVVLMDAMGDIENVPKMISDIRTILTEFSAEPLKQPSLLLDGGFYDYLLKFPHGTTDPNVSKKVLNGPAVPSLDSVQYPSISIFSRLSPRASPIPKRKAFPSLETENSVYGSFYKKTVTSELSVHQERVSSDLATFPDVVSPSTFSAPTAFKPLSDDRNRTGSIKTDHASVEPSTPVANRLLKPSAQYPPAPAVVSATSDVVLDKGEPAPPGKKGQDESLFSITEFHPNITLKRGSADLTDLSKSKSSESLKEDGIRKTPEVSRTNKPTVSSESVNPKVEPVSRDVQKVDRENLPPKSMNTVLNEISANTFDRTPGSRPHSPGLPAGQRYAPPPRAPSPVVREIPIVLEGGTQEKPIPEINRTLKPDKRVTQPRQFKFPDFSGDDWHKPFLKASVSKPGFTGLYNMGNTCYMNAVIQCLAHSGPVRELYLSSASTVMDSVMKAYDLPRSTKGVVTSAFIQCLRSLWSGYYEYFAPVFLKSALASFKKVFEGSAQQDGSEALQELLDLLHWDTNSAKLAGASREERVKAQTIENSENLPPDLLAKETARRHKLVNDTPIDSMLSFIRETVVKCMACRYESCTFNSDQMLMIALGADDGQVLSLSKLIATVMQADASVNRCQWNCPRCARDRPATQQFFFRSFPKLMFVQLNRFGNPYLPSDRKDERFVVCEQKLDLAPYCRLPSLTPQARYRLYGVVDHSGTLQSGHYTSNVLHADHNTWLRFDDDRVSPTSAQSVVSAKAYILFYERID
ncbi:ubiquitin carboxyl-terminal hydrolase 8-like [Paramacrobiotus metropolitanus]|uniref:ubiquitin carboxyl-terminal hydrolase 8-like n=1 Tax=Paramacrobiotus metropolitanus TaxID=2943436 RepID=UPI0024464CF2|nr:ubiquitin carboxyl-terminal hydrolase 8-like [Paramacrobiotus metropolitanus]